MDLGRQTLNKVGMFRLPQVDRPWIMGQCVMKAKGNDDEEDECE
jgi:hypothetical protein